MKKPDQESNPPDRLKQLGYPCPVKKEADPDVFQIRDSAAFNELNGPLRDRGLHYKTPVCLYPYRGEHSGDIKRGAEFYLSILPSDLLVLVTRPPLDDRRSKDKKSITRSHCHLEKAIFRELRKYFKTCCRSKIRLSEELIKAWAATCGENVSSVPAWFEFYQNGAARISGTRTLRCTRTKKNNSSQKRYSSMGFFIYLPEIPGYGCRFIASFGLGGSETLAWNKIVAERYPHWLDKPRFVAARMDFFNVPDCPVSLDYVDDVEVEILLDHEIEPPATSAAAKSPKSPAPKAGSSSNPAVSAPAPAPAKPTSGSRQRRAS